MTDHCPSGKIDVYAIRQKCPWCETTITTAPPRPTIHPDLERAMEVTLLNQLAYTKDPAA